MHVSNSRFETLVEEAEEAVLAQLPPDLRADAEQVLIVIAHQPSPEHLRLVPPGHTLLGLYQGVPLVQRRPDTILLTPDRVTLFRDPLAARCLTESELKTQIRRTLIHELGHYFGFSEAELAARGWG